MMKKIFLLIFFGLAFLFQNCKRYDLKLTGFDGKIVDKNGLPIDSVRIIYQITEPGGSLFSGAKTIEDSIKLSNQNGNFKIVKYLKSYQKFEFYILPPIKYNGLSVVTNNANLDHQINPGQYYKDVIITMSE